MDIIEDNIASNAGIECQRDTFNSIIKSNMHETYLNKIAILQHIKC